MFVEIPADLTKVNMKNRTIRLLLQKMIPLTTLELELKNNSLIVNTGWVYLGDWCYPISMTIPNKIRPYKYEITQIDWKNFEYK